MSPRALTLAVGAMIIPGGCGLATFERSWRSAMPGYCLDWK